MRYIGSKRTVLPFIKTTIEETYGKISNAIVADLFAGTACVGEMFKREGARVLSNDYLSLVRRLTSIANMRNLTLAGLTFHGY